MFLLLVLFLFLDLERILTLSLGFERDLILFLVLDFFCFKESLLGIYYNHIKKILGPLSRTPAIQIRSIAMISRKIYP